MSRSYLLYCLILLTIPQFLVAQNLDSLYAISNDASKVDTIRLQALEKIVLALRYTDPDSANKITDLVLEIAENKDLNNWKAKGLRLKGVCFFVKNDYIEAEKYYKKSLAISREYRHRYEIGEAYFEIGQVHYYQNNHFKAIQNYQNSLQYYEEHADKAKIYNNMGGVFYFQGNYPKALEYFIKSMKLDEEAGDSSGLSGSYINIGAIYFLQGHYKEALEYYKEGLKIVESDKSHEGRDKYIQTLATYANIAEAYLYLGEYTEAIGYLESAFDIGEKAGFRKELAFAYSLLGEIYSKQNQYNLANENFQKCLQISREFELKGDLTDVSVSLGKLNYEVGKFNYAITWCKKGLLLAKQYGFLVEQREACECLYKSNKALGNVNQALEFHEQYQLVSDSLQLQETQKRLQQMEFEKQIEADSILREKERLQAEFNFQREVSKEKTRRNIFIYSGIGLLVIAVALMFQVKQIQKSRAIIKSEKNRSENLLLNILPENVVEELKNKGRTTAKNFDNVSVLFTDFKGFTSISEKLSAEDLVSEINICYQAFDEIVTKYGLEKIKTIGDSYMAAGGLHDIKKSSIEDTIFASRQMLDFIATRKSERELQEKPYFEMRVGIHTGPVVAGIVGTKKFQYDIWGDTVNIASRMESEGEVGEINISEATYELIRDDTRFSFVPRGDIQVKNKGEMKMCFVYVKSENFGQNDYSNPI
jgi:adenylate cyclase